MEGKIPRFLAWIGMKAVNLPAGRRVAPKNSVPVMTIEL
jgi:hypothetical protein